ncbi:plasmid replication protein RepC [uncultured Roseobacter sp.]|uniref:plasmid replication protein RepC n=1 Tax=uncultured Roseobacter sp. TaxID=114847 RepID=UPI00260ABB91|nr:plasmid replication protein RepC [uncultured Roseobacter sp.]
MTQSGWRKPTPALGTADQLARDGEQISIAKTRSVVAAKRVGAHIGLKAADLLLLDTLAAFTQPQDWEEGRRPIVWASNAYLMERTGFSLSTLKRHARRLAEVGVITFRDSPNGKRWGRRDADGVIVEAYGFDLAPLSARVAEFEALAADLAAERTLCQRLRRQITIARRSIRARLEAALERQEHMPGLRRLQQAFEALLACLPGPRAGADMLQRLANRFADLLSRVEKVFLREAKPVDQSTEMTKEMENMDPREVITGPHIPITKQLHPVIRNSSENEEASAEPPGPATSAPVARTASDNGAGEANRPQVGIELGTILQACPEFTSWGRNLGGYIRDWRDFVRVAGELRPMIGISEHAWIDAQEQMGKPAAAAAFALVFEKVHSGEVNSPGGYLRGMVEKAGAGELHLERSFFGRLSEMAA